MANENVPTKVCSHCKLLKPITEFHKNRSRKDGLHTSCIKCGKIFYNNSIDKIKARDKARNAANPEISWAHMIKIRYGLTPKEYNDILLRQNGKCGICGGVNKDGSKLCADHDHRTKEVRGLLCNSCNWGIGHLKDSIYILRKAIEYLEFYNE
jgi:hypothetical protein